VLWVCGRRQVCAVGLCKETGFCVEGDRSVQLCMEVGLCSGSV
jgi:hypothetical protein